MGWANGGRGGRGCSFLANFVSHATLYRPVSVSVPLKLGYALGGSSAMLRISCRRADVVKHLDRDAAPVFRKHLHTRVIALPSSSCSRDT